MCKCARVRKEEQGDGRMCARMISLEEQRGDRESASSFFRLSSFSSPLLCCCSPLLSSPLLSPPLPSSALLSSALLCSALLWSGLLLVRSTQRESSLPHSHTRTRYPHRPSATPHSLPLHQLTTNNPPKVHALQAMRELKVHQEEVSSELKEEGSRGSVCLYKTTRVRAIVRVRSCAPHAPHFKSRRQRCPPLSRRVRPRLPARAPTA